MLFILTRNVNSGYLGFEKFIICKIPDRWYQNIISTYIGFPTNDFQSTDYFSIFPWLFLFLTGYFLYRMAEKKNVLSLLQAGRCKPVRNLGRNSLTVYLLHQPLLYVFLIYLLKM
jgi:uncharacterized membrane protein